MSAEALSKLSLGDTMVTTRAGAARARQPARTVSPSSSQTPSPTASLIESTRQLQYNVSDFDDDLRRRAKRGLMGDHEIGMKYCVKQDDAPAKYIFHLDDDITIAMGGSYAVPRCSCGANEGGRACKHIFWLGDQITSRVSEGPTGQPLKLTEDGSTVQDTSPATMLDELGLKDVSEGLGWVLQRDDLPEEEEEAKDAIADMLSVFEPNDALPEEFKCPDSPLTSERSRKYQEFAELFTQHAVKNHGLFIQLRDIIDTDFRTHVFFEKVNNRIVRMFKALDNYIANGPTTTSSEALDVTRCATKLKALVKAINDYHVQQDEDDVDMKDIAIRAAAALVNILDCVANRNVNAYENINWGGHGFIPPANPEENNLFVALIGSSSEDNGLFVLDALQALPYEVLRSHRETLIGIGGKLTQPWTPTDFVDAFRAITQEGRKRAASAEARGSEAKRPMQV